MVNDQTSVILYNSIGLSGTFWAGAVLVGGGFLVSLFIASLDKKIASQDEDDSAATRSSVAQALKRSFAANMSATSFSSNTQHTRSMHAMSFSDAALATPAKVDEDVPALSFMEIVYAVLKFKKCFWLLCFGCVVVYATVMPFNNIASSFLSHKYYPDYIGNKLHNGTCVPYSDHRHDDLKDDASKYANIWMMVPFSISAALSPFLGAFVDRVGMRAALMLVSAAVLTVVHLFLGITDGAPWTGVVGSSTSAAINLSWYEHPALGLGFMGLAYSFYAAAVWPAIVYVVDEDQVGTAYGLVTAVQNTGLALVPLMVGGLTEETPKCDPSRHSGGYANVEWLFVAFGTVGICVGESWAACDMSMQNLGLPGLYLHTLREGLKLNWRDPWAKADEDENHDDLTDPATPSSQPKVDSV